MMSINYSELLDILSDTPLSPWLETLPGQIEQLVSTARWGDLPQWQNSLSNLPALKTHHVTFNSNTIVIGDRTECNINEHMLVKKILLELSPWRKGPFEIFGVNIDSEWRSDWKWQRLQAHITPLENRFILDVGCGNGYYALRMLGEKAKLVIGIDPSPRFIIQFQALNQFINHSIPVFLLPLAMEQIQKQLNAFDTVFSMGVLYHRKSPFDHLKELFDALRADGELILETLVIDGKLHEALVPQARYAKMRNVWFLPSVLTMEYWLKRIGFQRIRCVDVTQTTIKEQRKTQWMHYESLQDFLNFDNHNLTTEGYPAPTRAIFIANKP